jgi:antitoxin component YwqK of YwqJK toxin-antitoxin module
MFFSFYFCLHLINNMKHNFRIFFRLMPFVAALVLISVSCNLKNKSQSDKNNIDSSGAQLNAVDSNKVSVITQRYSTGVIKAEIAVKGNKREGITKNYHEDGTLMSEIAYVNNEKNGISRDYYPNKKVRMEISYKRGIMQGDAKWYYQTGEVYRVTPYVNGKAEGIQKLYYKDGKVKAEVPYQSGAIAPGLKEYNVKGELLPMPTIVIEEQNKNATQGDFVLKMHLSNHMRNVKWYEGNLADWSGFPKALTEVLTNADGTGTLRIPAQPGSAATRTIYVYAVAETDLADQMVLKKKYELSFNR